MAPSIHPSLHPTSIHPSIFRKKKKEKKKGNPHPHPQPDQPNPNSSHRTPPSSSPRSRHLLPVLQRRVPPPPPLRPATTSSFLDASHNGAHRVACRPPSRVAASASPTGDLLPHRWLLPHPSLTLASRRRRRCPHSLALRPREILSKVQTKPADGAAAAGGADASDATAPAAPAEDLKIWDARRMRFPNHDNDDALPTSSWASQPTSSRSTRRRSATFTAATASPRPCSTSRSSAAAPPPASRWRGPPRGGGAGGAHPASGEERRGRSMAAGGQIHAGTGPARQGDPCHGLVAQAVFFSSCPSPSAGSTMHHLDLLIRSGAAAATAPSFHVDGGHDLHKELQGDKVIAKNDRDEIDRQE
ncbi:uncharacterized protein [Aegilops tauschii subsp. strangulata]|uniref:uncharacterized protein n=1 Tax=Aegilops tauschii subsp. strangulata TaxID=200361 RepID=UPI003CC88468